MLNKSVFWLWVFLLGFLTYSFSFAQTVKVTPASQSINPGQSATVKIETTSVEKCTITGKPYNNFDIIKNGNILLRPSETTEYVFNCVDTQGKSTSTKAKVTLVNTGVTNTTNTTNTQATSGSRNTNNTSTGGSSAAAAQQTQYSTQSVQSTANELCARYSNYSSVYPSAVGGGGGGSVPVDFTNLAPYLISIDRNTQLVGNEIRQDNLLRYCTEYQNMARATARLAETAAKTVKTIADACYADEQCMKERVYKASLEKEVKVAFEHPVYGRELGQLVLNIQTPTTAQNQQEEIDMQKYCNQMYAQDFYPKECILVPKAFEVIVEEYYKTRERIQFAQDDITNAFKNNGVMGARPCVETASGRAPEEVRFYEADCIRYRQEPSIINEEALRQITALPYTQAFSESSVLGYDGILDNINTRTREGNLVDPNISPTFGSSVGAGGGTGGTGGTNTGVDLKSVEENYKKIATNIGVIIQLYDVARLAYASSTSVCKNLPVSTRRTAVEKIDQNKKTYTDYLTELKKLWDAAVANPRENHSNLIVKINFDLKDKYNQSAIDSVYDSVKKLLQVCVDAGASS